MLNANECGPTPDRSGDAPTVADPYEDRTLNPEHRDHLLAELGPEGLAIALQLGARSIDPDEAHRLGFTYGRHRTGGLLLPFGEGFAQLRCDDPPAASDGQPVKYLSPKGRKQQPVTVGPGKPTLATEGFKDAIALHLLSGETVQGIAGVNGTESLAPSVRLLIYDADAALNPGVWGPLVAAGLRRPTLRLAFWPAAIAGPKGGACEFRNAGGDHTAVRQFKARELLRHLPTLWDQGLRVDWKLRALRRLAAMVIRAGIDTGTAQLLVEGAAKRIRVSVVEARRVLAEERRRAAPATAAGPQDRPETRLVSAAGVPPDGHCNAGGWASALSAGIGTRLRRNLLSQEIELDGTPLRGESEELLYVQAQRAGWKLKKPDCYDGTRSVALQNAYHPVREYLDRVAADPTLEPIDLGTLAARYLGVPDPLSAAMVRCLLIGAVARIHRPGCTAPGVVVLRGVQGIGKSKFWEALAGPFYVVSRAEDNGKDQTMAMHRSWFYDLDELDKVTTARQAAGLRSLITTPADTFRLPYARREEQFPRQFVIVGAVNGDGFLTDPEGNRRYWVIDCPQVKDSGVFIDGPGAARDRDAIWKAAVLAYRAGEPWHLTAAQQAASNLRNGQWEAVDEWQELLAGWAERTTTPGGFTTREALAGCGLRLRESINKADEMRAAEVLRRAGFQRQAKSSRRPDGARGRFWELSPLSPPVTTTGGEVVTPQTQTGAGDSGDLSPLSPPLQQVFKGKEGKGVQGERGNTLSNKGVLETAGGDKLPAAQIPCTASDPAVTTPRGGGDDKRPAPLDPKRLPVGTAVEVLTGGEWHNGWRTTTRPSDGRVQVTSSQGTRLVPLAEVRLCAP